MPKLSIISDQRKKECHPDLQAVVDELIKYIEFSVTCGHRGEKEQNDAFAKGFSKLKFPDSKHNKKPSEAIDIKPYPPDPQKKYHIYQYYYLAGAFTQVAMRLKAEGKIDSSIRWGGDWNSNSQYSDQNFHDLGHFEIRRKNGDNKKGT